MSNYHRYMTHRLTLVIDEEKYQKLLNGEMISLRSNKTPVEPFVDLIFSVELIEELKKMNIKKIPSCGEEGCIEHGYIEVPTQNDNTNDGTSHNNMENDKESKNAKKTNTWPL